MMSMKRDLQVFHIEELQTKGLQLHYQNHDLSLFLLLPEEVNGLEQVDTSVSLTQMESALSPMLS